MTVSLESLITPMTRQEVEASIYSVLAGIGVDTTSWKPGAVVRTMIVGVSVVLSAYSQLMALIARSGFLDLSEGDWLTLIALQVYGVERLEASFATGEITLTNTAGGVYSFDPGDLIFRNPDTGATYRNTEAGALTAHPSPGDTVTIAIQAIEVGNAGSSVPGAITDFVTPLLGVTCINTLSVAGEDAEIDAALRIRCRERLGALSPMGPWDAYGYAARTATRADGTNVGVARVRINKDGYGNVDIYVATNSGAVPGTVGDLSTDLGVVDEAIQQNAAPLAVTARVHTATAVALSVTYELWIYSSGRTDAEVQALIESKLGTFMQGQPIGGNVVSSGSGKVFLSEIRAVIGSALPEIIDYVVTVPAGDTTLTISQVPVLSVPVTCTAIHRVAPVEGQA
jgi:hypothetical protein